MTTTTYRTICETALGPLWIASNGRAVTEIRLPSHDKSKLARPDEPAEDPVLVEACRQLQAYFAGELHDFELELEPSGTPYQRRVWEELCRIPFGTTISYGELARRIGRPTACRAVGAANGRNPIAIVIPCHRVIGADGSLTGYGGGLPTKRWLLAHEGVVLQGDTPRVVLEAEPILSGGKSG
jgi:methylated-DNA-[protein]-cysteine S-methyltransferase